MEYRNKPDNFNNQQDLPFSMASEISNNENFVNITMNQDNGQFFVENQAPQDETPIKLPSARARMASPQKSIKVYAKSQQKNNNASQQKSMRSYNIYNSNTVERRIINQLKIISRGSVMAMSGAASGAKSGQKQ